MIFALAKLKRQAFRASLAEPEILNRCWRHAATPPRHCKELAEAEIDERLVTSWIGTLRDHVPASFTAYQMRLLEVDIIAL
jgi:hypothetical protein